MISSLHSHRRSARFAAAFFVSLLFLVLSSLRLPAQEPSSLPVRIMDMEECVQFGLQNNPRIQAAEFALRRAGADVQIAFADYLPRVDAGYQVRSARQVSSGLPPEVKKEDETEENDASGDSSEQDGSDSNGADGGMRLLERSLTKQAGGGAGRGQTRRSSSSWTKQNDVPIFNPFEELQQQLDQINQGLSQQTQAMASLDENLSQVNTNLGNLDQSLDELNVKLDELQETLNKRPIDTDSSSFDEDVWYLRVSQPLFTGFTITNTFIRSRLTREMTEAELEYARLEVARDIRQSFLNVLWAQQDRMSLEASVLRLEAQLDAAQAFFRLDLKPWLDVLQAEVDLNEAKENLSQIENAERIHTAKLLTQMGLPAQMQLELAGRLESFQPDFALSLRECWTEAREHRPDLFIAHKAVEIAEKDVHLAWGRFSPTASLDFSYHVQDKYYKDEQVAERYDLRNREYWTVGVTLNMNLFEGGRSQATVARARHELFRIRKNMLQQELEAAYDVEAAYLLLKEAENRIASSVKVREAAQEAYEMAVVRYRTEIGTHTELLDAQDRLTRAETRSNQARAQYNKARASLYFAMGWLKSRT